MREKTIIKTGVTGSVIAAVCCFTPTLTIALVALGLAAWVGWIDYVVLPVLALSLGLIAYGLWRRRRAAACCATEAARPTSEVRRNSAAL